MKKANPDSENALELEAIAFFLNQTVERLAA